MSAARRTLLLFGPNGQVGWELRRTLVPLGRVLALGRAEVDLSSPDAIRSAIRAHRPDVVVNAAAYTAVDRAESDEDAAFAINAVAPGVMAEESARLGARIIHYSTDYVFDGAKRSPYLEDDPVGPVSAYGRSKLAGEHAVQAANPAHLIFRTSWVYGARGGNFLRTMLRLFGEREEVRVVADQRGAPTWSRMIAEATAQAVRVQECSGAVRGGVYHLTAAGETSWHGFATAIHDSLGGMGATRRVTPIRTDEYPVAAVRPAYSVLGCAKLEADFGLALPPWNESLALLLEETNGAAAV